jgi:signal transduction histidine kinase
MVRRIRALTGEVRRSAASHYATPVEVRGSDEIAQLGGAFNEAAAEVRSHLLVLERRDRTLRSFLANTTHDVMLPLTVLQGHLATMKKRVAEGVLPNPDTVLAASEEAHYLASLVHNLSAAAKLETGEPLMQLNTVELNALVERVVERHRPIAEARGIELNYAVPEATLRVEGDLTLVEQAVSNLVHNAVRHNRPEGHVAVLLEETPGDSARFSLKVIDDGPGVPEEQLTHLGERRFRGDEARTRNPDGQGLGLHIARQVAERHGFELSFARAEQGGLEARLQGLCRVEQATRP